MNLKRYFRSITVLTAFSMILSPMAYAAPEKKSDPRCGYIPTERDLVVKMTDEDISFAEALDRIVDEKKDDGTPILNITDYTPSANLPSKFPEADTPEELKTYLSDKYPGVRNQNPFGTCWAHSAMALAEFYAINNLASDNNIDLSEAQLAYGAYRTRRNLVVGDDEALGGVNFDRDDEQLFDIGGNLEMAAQFLSKNFGYVKKDVFEYPTDPQNDTVFYNGMLRNDHHEIYESYDENCLHLLNMYEVDIKARPDIVKEAIKRNGIVGCTYFHPDGPSGSNGQYYDHTSFYDSIVYDPTGETISPTGPNHAVCIVGWDDDYPVGNFNPDCHPGNKGAWLIRNSWGDGSGFFNENSYFWMSYETGSLSNAVYIYDVTTDAGFDNVYYYDTQIHGCGQFGYPECDMKTANVFTVSENKEEILTEVAVEMGQASPYEVDIYWNLSDPKDPESGIKVEEAHVEGKFSFPGIYTIPLGKEVQLSGGDSFSVVVKTYDKGVMYETDEMFGSDNKVCYSTSGIKSGQSFYFDPNFGESWKDAATILDGNFCISAHTRNAAKEKEKLSASDFSFSAPASLKYDGKTHSAAVVSKSKEVGEISVFYEYTLSDGTKEWRDTPPTESGTYRVKINVAANDTYSSAHDLREEGWVFTISSSSSGDDPDKKDPDKKDPDKKDPDKKDQGNDDPDNNDPGKNDPENDDPENNDPENNDPENNDPGNNDPGKGKDSVSGDIAVKVPVKVPGGGSVEINYNKADNTWKTGDGRDVLVLSFEDGSDPGNPSYSFTGKKLTPGKEGFVVYKGFIYEYGSGYKISFKKNKNAGAAKAVVKWKKGSDPYSDGKKSERNFTVSPRAVSANMIDYTLKNGKVKNLTVTDDGIVMKPKKKDFSYSFNSNGLIINFKNNFSGSVICPQDGSD